MAAHVPDGVESDDDDDDADVRHERKFVIVSAKVINDSLGCSDHFASEHLRMIDVSMVSFRLFWFIWGNCIDFCVNGYGKSFQITCM